MDRRNEQLSQRVVDRTLRLRSQGRRSAALVRRAGQCDAETIAGWIEGWALTSAPNVAAWLGSRGDCPVRVEVLEWIDSVYGSFVLESGGVPVAFINVHSVAGEIEVGRLVVDPGHARKGFGSSLLMHVSRSISYTGSAQTTYARILRENNVAQAMIGKLPFCPAEKPVPDETASWFKFAGTLPKSLFGEALLHLRTSKRLRQEEVGFLADIGQPSVAMLESGRRPPSPETMLALCNCLNLSRGEKAQLLFGLVGERLRDEVRRAIDGVYKTTDGVWNSTESHLWVISESFLEDMSEDAVAISAKSVSEGYHRWYFAPPGYFESGKGVSLIERIVAKATDKNSARNGLRLYTAPSALCSMRLVVENPPHSINVEELKEARVSFGGSSEADRAILPIERAKEFVLSVVKVITRLPHDKEVDGFRLDISGK